MFFSSLAPLAGRREVSPRAASMRIKTVGATILFALVGGCEKADDTSFPTPDPGPFIKAGTANQEAQCPCQNAAGVYAYNPRKQQVEIQYTIYEKDLTSGLSTAKPYNRHLLPAATTAGPSKTYVGCNQHAPATSCRFRANYVLDSFNNANLAFKAGLKGLPVGMNQGAETVAICRQICSTNSPECLQLGARYFKGIAPITRFAQNAPQTGTIPQKEVMNSYGLPASKDECKRGDITIQNGAFVNNGKVKTCVVRNEDLPVAVARKLGLLGVGSDPLGMMTSIPQHLQGRRESTLKISGVDRIVVFDRNREAPLIAFDGAGGPQLSRRYGGAMLGTAKITIAGRPDQTVLATTNGCIAIDEP